MGNMLYQPGHMGHLDYPCATWHSDAKFKFVHSTLRFQSHQRCQYSGIRQI